MITKISSPVYTVNRSEPITSGFESFDVRNSTPYQKQRYLDQTNAENPSRCQLSVPPGGNVDPRRPLPLNPTPLVYSSISDTKCKDHVKRIDLYPVSARVIREKIFIDGNKTPPNRTGTEIQGFSLKSKARLRFTAANADNIITSQFCMTYGDVWPINGRSLKYDLTLFLKRQRKTFDNLSYIWIAEFQDRGAAHFHFFSNLAPIPENHNKLSAAWYDIAGYGQDKVLRVHAHETNFIPWNMGNAGYLCKYLDKEAQKSIPPGFQSFGRFWGNSQDLTPKIQDFITADELELFTVHQEEPFTYLVRNLCRYMEKINSHSTIRTTPQSRTILTGAKIANKLRDYITTPPKGW